MSTAFTDSLYSIADGIGHVVFNRPQSRNALTFEMYAHLADICRNVPTDGSLRAIVISGAGGKAFAAGTDISLFRDFKGADSGVEYEEKMAVHLGTIEACPIPMIAAMTGACTGGGAAIAACCDLRIASADMKFGFPIARTLGNCLSAANLAKLASLLGPARVTEIIFTSRLMTADEAKAAGLVTEVLPDHDATVARAMELARQVASMAPITLRVTKELLRRVQKDGASAHDEDMVRLAYGSRDFREGLESFLAKRPPQWSGR
ncbi:MAG TPA: enoyl-CoA hydratase [Hyphomicrobiaceae bacterium]|nr:enoyl-CoA hydratase [Hyphomicrobiaceae bacterium]